MVLITLLMAQLLSLIFRFICGVLAQLVERLLRMLKVKGSIPLGSTPFFVYFLLNLLKINFLLLFSLKIN